MGINTLQDEKEFRVKRWELTGVYDSVHVLVNKPFKRFLHFTVHPRFFFYYPHIKNNTAAIATQERQQILIGMNISRIRNK